MPRTPSKTLEEVEQELSQQAAPDAAQGKRDAPKELIVIRRPVGLYAIAFTAGGEVPDALKGSFTSSVRAQQAIDWHLAGRLV